MFNSKRGVIPIRFTLTVSGTPACQLPLATIRVTRTASATTGLLAESVYVEAADSGSNFRIADCQYLYNLAASSLGAGHYRAEILVDRRHGGSRGVLTQIAISFVNRHNREGQSRSC